MKFGNSIKSLLAAVALGMSSPAVLANPVHFFGNLPFAAGNFPTDPASPPLAAQALFRAAVDVTLTETFESRPYGSLSGSAYGNSNSMTVFAAGNTLSQSAPAIGFGGVRVEDITDFGRFNTTQATGASQWAESDSSFTINLADAIGALAFFGTDFGDFQGSLTISLYNVVNGIATLVEDNAFTDDNDNPLQPRTAAGQDGSLLFFGYASSNLFNRIVFNVAQTGGRDYLGFDDLMVGNLRNVGPTPTPEPGSLALVGLALFAAGWARRTQRKA